MDNRLTDLECLLLAALHASGPTHAYRMARDVETSAGRNYVSVGALYKALHRMEEAGFVKSAWETVDASVVKRPRRRVYQIIGAGEQALQRHSAARDRLLRLSQIGAAG